MSDGNGKYNDLVGSGAVTVKYISTSMCEQPDIIFAPAYGARSIFLRKVEGLSLLAGVVRLGD